MAININRCTNANVYVDGENWLGRCEEATMPEVKPVMAEHKGLGMLGKMEFFSGIDKMEAKFKWNSIYPEILKRSADFTNTVQLQVRSSIEQYTNQQLIGTLPYIATLRGQFKSVPGGNFKHQDNVEMESMFNCTYYKLEIAGEVIFEIDQINNKYIVDGVDKLAQYRANLGL